MKKFIFIIAILIFIIISCGNTQTENIQTNQTNETIPATKILSQSDAAFLAKVKNKIIIKIIYLNLL